MSLNPDSQPVEEPDATLKPPQFTLRALLLGTALVAGILSVLIAVGTAWAVAVLFFAALVAAHVAGNALGTRMRDRSAARPEAIPQPRPHRPVKAEVRVAPTRLAQRRPLHGIILVLALCGAVAGGYFGGTALAETYPDSTVAARVMAHVSSGVLGGLGVFVLCSFAAVVRHALGDAHAASDRYRPSQWKPGNPGSTSTPGPSESLDRQ